MQPTDVRGEAKDIWLHVELRGGGHPQIFIKNFVATDTFLPEAPIFRGLSQFWHLVIFHLPLFTDVFGRSTVPAGQTSPTAAPVAPALVYIDRERLTTAYPARYASPVARASPPLDVVNVMRAFDF